MNDNYNDNNRYSPKIGPQLNYNDKGLLMIMAYSIMALPQIQN